MGKRDERDNQLNGDMFVIAQSDTRIDQEVLTSLIRRSWKKSHNGRTGR
jgi:hypothetical protein